MLSYQEVVEHCPDGLFWLAARDGRQFVLAGINPAMERILGGDGPRTQAFLASLGDLSPCLDADAAVTRDAVLRLPGNAALFRATLTPIRAASGRVERVLGVMRDVTAQQESEERRMASEQAFHALADLIPDTVARYDDQCIRTYANANFARTAGVSVQALLGKRPSDYNPSPQALAYEQLMRDALSDGRSRQLEYVWPGKDGNPVTSHIRLVAERDAAGRVVSVLATGHDVTQLQKTEKHLEETRMRLSKILQILPDLVWLTDPRGTFQACSAAVERWLGAREADILGRTYHDFLPTAVADHAMALDARAMAEGHLCVSTDWGSFADDKLEVLFETRRVPMVASNGEPMGVLAVARDVTRQRQLTEQLASREEEFRSLAENSPDCIVRYNRDCRRVYVNPAYLKASGLTAHAVLGATPLEMSDLSPTHEADYQEKLVEIMETGVAREIEVAWGKADGQRIVKQLLAVPERDKDGNIVGVLSIARDITALKESEQRLEEAEAMARLGHWHWDFQRKTNSVSTEICRIFGKPRDWSPSRSEIFGTVVDGDRQRLFATLDDAVTRHHEEVSIDYQIMVGQRRVDVHTQVRIRYDGQGRPAQLIGTTQDVTELRAYQQRLHSLSNYDALTLLPNRDLLRRHMQEAIDGARQRGSQVVVVILDLDNFKVVNDSMGRATGDHVLTEIARRLRNCVGDGDIVARLDGDEFALLLRDVAPDFDVAAAAREVLDAVSRTNAVNGNALFVTASIGIARFPLDGDEVSTLLRFADAAMHHAKEQGRDNAQFYSSAFIARTSRRLALTSDLRHALAREELELFYQPKISLDEGHLMGAEALLRWNHPHSGRIPPDEFIPIAEETGLILDIGHWVLRSACAAVCEWNRTLAKPMRIAVNLSSRQFRGNDLVGMVESVLRETGCPPQWLELEITESLLLKDSSDVARTLAHFASRGITLAIDDFGTGYSSMAYLNRFPIHTLKIDKSFIFTVTEPSGSAPLVQAILAMSRSMRMTVVAEGVEKREQADWLAANGCQIGQGYLWGKPMPEADLRVFTQPHASHSPRDC